MTGAEPALEFCNLVDRGVLSTKLVSLISTYISLPSMLYSMVIERLLSSPGCVRNEGREGMLGGGVCSFLTFNYLLTPFKKFID